MTLMMMSHGSLSLDERDCRHLAVVAMNEGLYLMARGWILMSRRLTDDKAKRKVLKRLDKFAKAGVKVMVIVLWVRFGHGG